MAEFLDDTHMPAKVT